MSKIALFCYPSSGPLVFNASDRSDGGFPWDDLREIWMARAHSRTAVKK